MNSRNPYDLKRLYASLDPRFPSLHADGTEYTQVRDAQVWHVFSSPNCRPTHVSDDPNVNVCNDCGLIVTKAEIDAAYRKLNDLADRGRPVKTTWPEPLIQSVEDRLEPMWCPGRIPSFMGEVVYREGWDEPFDDEASGLTLWGRVSDETFRRTDAVGLQKGEEREELTDSEFYSWWWSINEPTDWTKRAFKVLQWVREQGRKATHARSATIKVSDGRGGYFEVPDHRYRSAPEPEPADVGSTEGDDEICSTCECFRPCDCPPAVLQVEEEAEWDGLCLECECFLPCACPVGEDEG